MFAYFWPLVLVVTANVFYNISSRSVPKACDAFMALVCTYGFYLFPVWISGDWWFQKFPSRAETDELGLFPAGIFHDRP